MTGHRVALTAVAAFVCAWGSADAQTLRVGIVGTAPFVARDEGGYQGICPDIWREVAQTYDMTYEWVPRGSAAEAVEAVARGELDAAVGPISITSARLKQVAFTQPFYRAEIGALVHAQPASLWSRIRPFFREAVLISAGALLLLLFLVGNLIWLLERKKNGSQFPDAYLAGVGNGMWFAVVTLTTVGYGDRVPVSLPGRIVAGVWMIVTMLIASSLTAGLATAFTLSLSGFRPEALDSVDDLAGRPVGVVKGSTGADLAREHGARVVEAASLEAAVDLLGSRRVEAVVFDAPMLRYYLRTHPGQPFVLADFSLAAENYGFVFRMDSRLIQLTNVRLLDLQESGKIGEITRAWLE